MKRSSQQPGLFDAEQAPLWFPPVPAPEAKPEAVQPSLDHADWQRWKGARCTLEGHPAFIRKLGEDLAIIEPIALDVDVLYTSWAAVEDVMILFNADFDRERDEAE